MMSDFAIEQVRKWIDGGGDSWGLPMQSIEKVLAGYIEARAQIAAKDAQIRLLNELAAQRTAMIDELLGHFPPKQEDAV